MEADSGNASSAPEAVSMSDFDFLLGQQKSSGLHIWGNRDTMNMNTMILTNIKQSPYFKHELLEMRTFTEVVDEIYYKVSHLEPWERGSRRTAGLSGASGGGLQVRGVGAGGIVSTAYCLLYKLFTLRISRKQLQTLLDHHDSPYIRGLGFMFIRYCLDPKDYWDWFSPYMDDREEIEVKAGGGSPITIGEMLRQFLTQLDWFSTLFPRIPVPVEKELRARLQDRQSAAAAAAAATARRDGAATGAADAESRRGGGAGGRGSASPPPPPPSQSQSERRDRSRGGGGGGNGYRSHSRSRSRETKSSSSAAATAATSAASSRYGGSGGGGGSRHREREERDRDHRRRDLQHQQQDRRSRSRDRDKDRDRDRDRDMDRRSSYKHSSSHRDKDRREKDRDRGRDRDRRDR